jgi:hypothetical protein
MPAKSAATAVGVIPALVAILFHWWPLLSGDPLDRSTIFVLSSAQRLKPI